MSERLVDIRLRLEAAQKPPHGVAAWSRFINRPLGRQIAAVAFRVGLGPNQVTLVSALLTFSGIALIAGSELNAWTSVLVGILLVTGYAVDSADGQVARLTGTSSALGEWLDHTFDCLKTASIHLAVAVHMFRFVDLDGSWMYAVPLAFSVVAVELFFGQILMDQLRRAAHDGTRGPQTGSLSVVGSLAKLPFDYGLLAAVLGLLHWWGAFFVIYCLLLAGTTLALLVALSRWVGMLRAIDEAKVVSSGQASVVTGVTAAN